MTKHAFNEVAPKHILDIQHVLARCLREWANPEPEQRNDADADPAQARSQARPSPLLLYFCCSDPLSAVWPRPLLRVRARPMAGAPPDSSEAEPLIEEDLPSADEASAQQMRIRSWSPCLDFASNRNDRPFFARYHKHERPNILDDLPAQLLVATATTTWASKSNE